MEDDGTYSRGNAAGPSSDEHIYAELEAPQDGTPGPAGHEEEVDFPDDDHDPGTNTVTFGGVQKFSAPNSTSSSTTPGGVRDGTVVYQQFPWK